MPYEKIGDGPNDPIDRLCDYWGLRFIGYIERKLEKRRAKKNEQIPQDRAASSTAAATIWMAAFTCILAGVGIGTMCILKNQLEEMKQDQRAWMGGGDYTYSITDSGPISSTAMVLNFGKTPALDILHRITGTTKPNGYILTDSDIIYPVDLPTLKSGTLFPNQHIPLNAGGPPMDPEKQKIWFNNVARGDWIQYFFGDIRYKDIFGKDHWTHFCTQYVPVTKGGTPCAIYNDTDDEKMQ